jgi:hypothetical protein
MLSLASLVLLASGGCEALVPGDVEAFRCGSSAASSCPPGSVCATATGACVGASEACTLTGCVLAQVCDPGSLQCIDGMTLPDADVDTSRPPVDSGVADTNSPPDTNTPKDAVTVDTSCAGQGCPCSAASDCPGLLCAGASVLGGLSNAGFCTQTCCDSADCPPGDVCYASGSPGSFCVSTRLVGREAPGMGGAGAQCSQDGDCRSASCTNGRCLDTCCSDTDCGSGSSCELDTTAVNGHEGFFCERSSGSGSAQAGANCSQNSTCQSGACVGTLIGNVCGAPCCGQASCASVGGGIFNTCERASVETQTNGPDYVALCNAEITGAAFGAQCGTNTDCMSQACDPSAGTCTDLCCVDSDCAGYGNFVCRPSSATPPYLICVAGGTN